jgi:hypothetical protein
MMPYALSGCHQNSATRRQTDQYAAPKGGLSPQFVLVTDEPQQWIGSTPSRRLPKGKGWLRAVRFMVSAGFHPRATETTLRVARDLARRVSPGTATVAYCLDGMTRRLRLSRRCITQHVQVLRELGLLAWAERGNSRRNALRRRAGFGPGTGFRACATIYAVVAPRVWDDAMGRRISGEGYDSRVCGVTDEGREREIAEVRAHHEVPDQPVDNPEMTPVDNGGSCTPSVLVPQPRTSGTRRRGENKDKSRQRATRPRKTSSTNSRTTAGSTGWTARQTAYAIEETRFVQLYTWWTQGACPRQLAYVLRPFFKAGWAGPDIARELARWTVPLRPQHVPGYVAAELRRRANTGLLYLPDGLVTPYRTAPASEGRYDAWKAERAAEMDERWLKTWHLREEARKATPKARTTGRRWRAVGDASAVLCTTEELKKVIKNTGPILAMETVWQEHDEAVEARLKEEGRYDVWELAPAEPCGPHD